MIPHLPPPPQLLHPHLLRSSAPSNTPPMPAAVTPHACCCINRCVLRSQLPLHHHLLIPRRPASVGLTGAAHVNAHAQHQHLRHLQASASSLAWCRAEWWCTAANQGLELKTPMQRCRLAGRWLAGLSTLTYHILHVTYHISQPHTQHPLLWTLRRASCCHSLPQA
jgi:hypothetical protein